MAQNPTSDAALSFTADEESFLRETWGNALYDAVRKRLTSAPLKEPERRPSAGPASSAERLNAADFIGQRDAKEALNQVIAIAKVNQERKVRGLKAVSVTLHAIFAGSPGTGKTTFARYYAQEIRDLGILKKGNLIEVTRQDLVGEFMGQTASKTAKVVKEAAGGVLFIDEAYSLKQSKDDTYGQECIDALLKLMEDLRDDLIVILAGYTEPMRAFLQLNPGLQSRIPNWVVFADFTDAELGAIWDQMVQKAGLHVAPEVRSQALADVVRRRRGKSFGNAREVRNIFERSLAQQSARLGTLDLKALSREALCTLTVADVSEATDDESAESTPATPLAALAKLRGLEQVKKEIQSIGDFLNVSRARQALGDVDLNMVFLGNSGTGRTTVARLFGQLLRDLGVLPSGHTVEASRTDLVGSYLGQTAPKTREKLEAALGGVLIVEEPYSLLRAGDSYGQEALDELLRFAEEQRGKFVAILAGLAEPMQALLAATPALQGLFPRTLHFGDFSPDELVAIAQDLAQARGYSLSAEAQTKLRDVMQREMTEPSFGNARGARRIMEGVFRRQASRLAQAGNPAAMQPDLLNCIDATDVVLA